MYLNHTLPEGGRIFCHRESNKTRLCLIWKLTAAALIVLRGRTQPDIPDVPDVPDVPDAPMSSIFRRVLQRFMKPVSIALVCSALTVEA